MMCRSRPRLRLCTESCRTIWGRAKSRPVDDEVLSESNSTASSSSTDAKLPERLGTSDEYLPSEFRLVIEIAGVVLLASETGSQQKVSLVHNLHDKFSSLRPSSRDPAHLEKTVHISIDQEAMATRSLTCPHAEEILDVSCIYLV